MPWLPRQHGNEGVLHGPACDRVARTVARRGRDPDPFAAPVEGIQSLSPSSYSAHTMPQVKAAFTVSSPVTAEQVKEAAYSAAQKMNIQLAQFQAGVADDWCILSARLTVHGEGEAEAWALLTTMALKASGKAGQPAVFRLDVVGTDGGDPMN